MQQLAEPLCACDPGWAMLPLRLALGAILVHAGWGKFRRGVGGFGDWLGELGYPLPHASARLVAALELLGGLAILGGLLAHWIAIPLIATMAAAAWTNAVKLRLPFAGSERAQGYELDLLMIAALAALVLGGSGPLSADALLWG